MNHSCDPNVGVVGLNESGSYDFVALADIGVDEVRLTYVHCTLQNVLHHALTHALDSNTLFLLQELTFDYETTEYEIGAFSKCLCGSPNCRGKVYGYKHSGNVIREKYLDENISSYLLQPASSQK